LQQGEGRRRPWIGSNADRLLVDVRRFLAREEVGELLQPTGERRCVGGGRRLASGRHRQREHCELFDAFGGLRLARGKRSQGRHR
jgi:hypothetical protein